MNEKTKVHIPLRQKHHYRQLLQIGIPIIIGQLGTIVLGLADTLMIGHHSTRELAAAGLVNNVFALVLVAYMGFSYGLTPVVGRLYGMERSEEIGQKVRNSLLANLLVGILFTVLMAALYLNLHRIGQPSELLSLIRPYFMVNLVSILFVGVFNTLKQFLDGIARPQVSMWVMIVGNLVNVLFNWLLIYGVGGFPEMGLLGAGIATLGSRIFMAVALVAVVMAFGTYRTYREGILRTCFNKPDFLELNRLGWPVALQLGLETAAFSLSSVMAGWLGTIALAAHQVMISLSMLFCLVLSGLASATSIRVSHVLGQEDHASVRGCAFDGLRLSLLCSAVIAVPVMMFRHNIGALFTDNGEVQRIVAQLIIVLVVYQVSDGTQYTFANALRGISCVRPMAVYAFFAYFVVSLPLGYTLGFPAGLGILGIWSAFPIALSIAGWLYWRRFMRETRGSHN